MGRPIPIPTRAVRYLQGPGGRANLAGLGLLLILLPAWWWIGSWYQSRLLAEERARVAGQAADHANALTLAISRRLARLQGLHAFVLATASNADFADEFRVFAADLYRESQAVRNIALAPGGVVLDIYPLAGNESVIGYQPGLDPRPEVRADVALAISSGRPVLSGPIELLLGGLGVVGHQAVFIDGEYWGLVSIVVEYEALLRDAGLSPQPEDLSLALLDAAGERRYGEVQVLADDPVLQQVALTDSSWTLAAVPAEGWLPAVSGPAVTLRVGGLLIAGLLTALVVLSVNRQARLAAEVELRTREVRQANEQLRLDIEARARLEQQLEAQVKARTQELASLLEIGRKVGSTLELDQLLEVILDELKQVVDYSSARISVLQPEGLEVGAVRGADPGAVTKGTRVPLSDALARRVVQDGETVLMADVQDGQDPLQGAGPDAHRSRNGVRSYLALPLRVKGKVVGALGLDHALPNFYGPKEVELASAFAHQVAAGIENARLFSESRKLAVVEERGRLARDLHDSVTQMLYSLTLFAEAARRALLAEDRPLAEEHLARLRETARQSLKEMRLLVFQLRTSPLEGHSLSDALEARLDAVEKRAGVEAELALEGAQRLSPAAQDELYWIAQEALNNALKHSAADQVQLRLRVTSAGAEFEISDNGRGFDPSRARSGGMGLGSLRERAVRLGGRVEVDSAPRAGTRIRVHLGQPALADLPREAAPHD